METLVIKFTPDVLVLFKTVPSLPAASTAARLDPGTTINGIPFDGTTPIVIPTGTGDVVGPAGAMANEVALFDGATGKLIKGGGLLGSAAFLPNYAFPLRDHVPINVKDWGATGDGTTDDHAAIAVAIALMTNNSALYFPPGKYRTTASWTLSSLSNIKIFGDAAEINNDSGAAGGNTFVINASCNRVEFHDIAFTGTSSVRGNGCHIRLFSNSSGVYNCEFGGCSDFGVQCGGTGGWQAGVEIIGNVFNYTLGDGVHIGACVFVLIEGNLFNDTGDDAIGIVADDPAYQPNRILINANNIFNAGMSGTSGVGIRVAEGVDVTITSNRVYVSQGEGIRITRYLSTTTFNARIFVANNAIIYANQIPGPLSSLAVEFTNECTLLNNTIDAPVAGGGISFLDCNRLVIQGNAIKTVPTRAIASDDGTTANVAANCQSVIIMDNVLEDIGNGGLAMESIYVAAASGKTIENVVISGNVSLNGNGPTYIFTNRLLNTAKVVNNTSLDGQNIVNGGVGVVPTLANNN
jgi:hypothetical protein